MKDISVRALISDASALATARGFGNVSPTERIAMIQRRLSNALGHVKRSRIKEVRVDKDGKPVGFAADLAKAVISIADLAASCGTDLASAIATELTYSAKKARKGKP